MKKGEFLELLIHQPIFIGFKADSNIRQHLESLSEIDKQYFNPEDSTFLRVGRVGEDIYVGKLVFEGLTTEHVEDIRRNIISIMRKIGSEGRLPINLRILACSAVNPEYVPTGS